MESERVIVVGAGCFGLAGALELRRRGHDVVVYDPGPVPHPDAASTDISKIVRMDYGDDPFYLRLAREAMEAWPSWNRRRRLYHRTGFLVLSRSALEPGGFEYESRRLLAEHGVAVETLDAAETARRFPAWRESRFGAGYYNPAAGWVASGEAVGRIAEEAAAAGVVFRKARVSRLLEDGRGIVGIETADGDTAVADRTVVAVGAWTSALVPRLRDVLVPRGQPVLHFAPADPAPYRAHRFPVWALDIAETGWYGFPVLPDGTLKVGNHGRGVAIDADAPRVIDPVWEERARAFFREHVPALAAAPLRGARLCLYCDSPDGDFWIDRDPEREGLVVAAGGSGHGFKFMPVIGGVIADVVEGKENEWARRFRWREPGGGRKEHARAR